MRTDDGRCQLIGIESELDIDVVSGLSKEVETGGCELFSNENACHQINLWSRLARSMLRLRVVQKVNRQIRSKRLIGAGWSVLDQFFSTYAEHEQHRIEMWGAECCVSGFANNTFGAKRNT
jgi:hypothetical protein